MKYQQLTHYNNITGNRALDTWLTYLGYDAISINQISSEEHDPAAFAYIETIAQKLNSYQDKKIMICADYDCDGMMGCVILMKGLRALGFTCDFTIPDRIQDGYGMKRRQVDIAIKEGASLILTVDNGIACHDAIDYALEKGIDVIVSDHHEIDPLKGIPNCLTLHPAVKDEQGNGYPYRNISGATVAYKFISYLMKRAQRANDPLLDELCCYAGITVISDVMPLLDENRTIYARSVRYLLDKKSETLTHFLDLLDITMGHIDEITYGWSIAPVINSMGRIGDPKYCVQYFLTNSKNTRRLLGAVLLAVNDKRKEMLKECQKQLDEEYAKTSSLKRSILLFSQSEIHEGIIGILAGRYASNYRKPSAVFVKTSIDGVDCWKGSGRSIPGVNLYEALQKVHAADPDIFINFGGHAGAAGLCVRSSKKDTFISLFEDAVKEQLSHEYVQPYVSIEPQEMEELLLAIRSLKPFGEGFAEPIIRVNFQVSCAKCYFRSGNCELTNDHFSIREPLEEMITKIKALSYKLIWSNYDKLLIENSDAENTKTEFYRPTNQTLTYDLVAGVNENFFGGKYCAQLDVLQKEEV